MFLYTNNNNNNTNNNNNKNNLKNKNSKNKTKNKKKKKKTTLLSATTSLLTLSCFETRRGRLSRSEVDPAAPFPWKRGMGVSDGALSSTIGEETLPLVARDDLSHLSLGMRLSTLRKRCSRPRREQRFSKTATLARWVGVMAGEPRPSINFD